MEKGRSKNFFENQVKQVTNEASSYRPISLTSYLCKCLEKILFYRLYGFVEHNNLLDPEQEGFRKYRSTTQALLRFTQRDYQCLNDKQHTLAIFIDLEKAYDSVWRDGLLYKMYHMGIKGKMWNWLHSFLSNRQVSIKLNQKEKSSFSVRNRSSTRLSDIIYTVQLIY